MKSPLAGREPGDIDFWVVRENTEGEYSNAGGRMFPGTDREFAVQESIFTRHGTDRVLRFAFELAQSRPKRHLTSATKSNGISITMPYWDERVRAVAESYPDVRWDQYHIDILTAHFVLNPDRFDVVVASNLFGDILSDLGPACTGTIGIAPSGNINPERRYPSVFEPVHGSAPDIAGQGLANPIGQIWSGAMMLEHLGEREAAAEIVTAIERVLSEKTLRTRDLGGNADTAACGRAVEEALGRSIDHAARRRHGGDHRLGRPQGRQPDRADHPGRADRIDPGRLRGRRRARPYPRARGRRVAFSRSRPLRPGAGGHPPPLPRMIVQFSTSGAEPNAALRGACLAHRPDMASLTTGSTNFSGGVYQNPAPLYTALAERMRTNGVRPEIEVFDLSHLHNARRLIDAGRIDARAHVQFVLGIADAMPADPHCLDLLLTETRRLLPQASWGAFGIGRFQREAIGWALARGATGIRTG